MNSSWNISFFAMSTGLSEAQTCLMIVAIVIVIGVAMVVWARRDGYEAGYADVNAERYEEGWRAGRRHALENDLRDVVWNSEIVLPSAAENPGRDRSGDCGLYRLEDLQREPRVRHRLPVPPDAPPSGTRVAVGGAGL